MRAGEEALRGEVAAATKRLAGAETEAGKQIHKEEEQKKGNPKQNNMSLIYNKRLPGRSSNSLARILLPFKVITNFNVLMLHVIE